MLIMIDLTNKIILVTGATGYIGSSMARALYDTGATLILQGRSHDKLQQVYTQEFAALPQAHRVITQVSTLDSAAAAQAFVNHLVDQSLLPDIVVNCIGYAEDKPFVFHQWDDAAASFAANLFPFVHLSTALLPHFQQRQSGNFINLASITGLVGQPMRSLYGAAKGAIIAYCKVLARRHAVDNIRVNAIAPQVVTGGLADKMNPKIKALLQATTPIKRDCTAQDLIAPLMMLASESEGFITGEVVNVTGGLITW
jgi:3-oxoacyl-[acyl-carrier protein] reductase